MPELGENFRKGPADISRQSLCRASVSAIGTCEVYLAARIQHFEYFLWCRLKKVELQEANRTQIPGGCRICDKASAEAAMVRKFTVTINPSQDNYRENRQDATEVQFFNIARLMVGHLSRRMSGT